MVRGRSCDDLFMYTGFPKWRKAISKKTIIRHDFNWKTLKNTPMQAALIATFISLSLLLDDLYAAGLATLFLFFWANRIHTQYMRALIARTESKVDFSWEVNINDVKVSSIRDSDYALIRHKVFSDVRVCEAQMWNLVRVVIKSFDYCFIAIPLGLFWVGVELIIFSPETTSTIYTSIQGATTESIKSAALLGGSSLIFVMPLIIASHWMLGLSRFGFINRFDEAIATAVRKHCGIATLGTVVLSRWEDGGLLLCDEMAFLRHKATKQ